MRSIAVNLNTYDIFMAPDRNLAIVTDRECVQQDCLLASQMFRGEFPYDTTRGVPFMETVFRNKNPYEFEDGMKAEIMKVPNVVAVRSFRLLQVDDVLQYEANIQTTYGSVVL